MLFAELIGATIGSGEVRAEIDELLAQKRMTSELGRGARRPVLDSFFHSQVEELQAIRLETPEPVTYEELDEFFRTWVKRIYG